MRLKSPIGDPVLCTASCHPPPASYHLPPASCLLPSLAPRLTPQAVISANYAEMRIDIDAEESVHHVRLDTMVPPTHSISPPCLPSSISLPPFNLKHGFLHLQSVSTKKLSPLSLQRKDLHEYLRRTVSLPLPGTRLKF